MAETLYELLNRCTVRIVHPATQEPGTGFFVAPGQVVTCAHVVNGVLPEVPVLLFWREQQNQPFREMQATVEILAENQDLALLVLQDPPAHPCVWLDEGIGPLHDLYSFGYPEYIKSDGTSVRFTCEGWTERDTQTLLTLANGQVSPGMSGAPLLSLQTGQVCGILAITRDQGSNLGGRAILTRTLWQVVPALQDEQAAWKQQDQRWRNCLEEHRSALSSLSPRRKGTIGQANRPKDYLPLSPNPLFQERHGEFAELERLLFGQAQPARLGLIGVVGMGGVGKTQLTVELAVRYRERFPAGIFWMPAAGHTIYDWQRQLALLAERTGYLPPDDTPGQPDTELRRAKHFATYLAEHTDTLLILDNVEQPALVTSALPTLTGNPQPACTLLYTSRVPVTTDGRVSLHHVNALQPAAALHLLLAETRPVVLEEALTDSPSAEASAARELCQAVDFLPLGLVHLRRLLARRPDLTLARLADGVREKGALEIAKYEYPDAKSLFATFLLSWEQVQDARAQQLFYLASFFPEAIPIPLWLLGLAAGLGERSELWEPLGEAYQPLYESSLLEPLADGQVRLHPLVREFARRIIAKLPRKGKSLAEKAGVRLGKEFWHLNHLEQRARREGYWGCLEQVRAAQGYATMLGSNWSKHLWQMERLLGRESHFLGKESVWEKRHPGLFFQQLFNRAVEVGQTPPLGTPPARWIRQLESVGAEDQSLLSIFAGHSGGVYCVAFSPDGKQVLTGSEDETARLWEAATGQALAILSGHEREVTSVVFSPDGKQVLTAALDETARLWEAATGQLLVTLSGHDRGVTSVAFSPDGKQVLTGSNDQTAWLWEAATGQALAILSDHVDRVTSVVFSPDGKQVLTCSEDYTARLWEAATGQALATLSGHDGEVTSAAFSPDGKQVLTSTGGWKVWVWEAARGKELATLTGYEHLVSSVAFSSDGRLVVVTDAAGWVYFWAGMGTERWRLLGVYVAPYRIKAIHWQDRDHLLLADTGGPSHKPNFYRLMLEGI